jgi:hypothetical protein
MQWCKCKATDSCHVRYKSVTIGFGNNQRQLRDEWGPAVILNNVLIGWWRNASVTLNTLGKAARALGRKVKIELVLA